MKYKFKFFLDTRFQLENGNYSVKVNLYSFELKTNSVFKINNVFSNNGNIIEVSCKSKKEFDEVWINRFKKDSFGNETLETTVYGSKLEVRTILKVKQDILNEIIQRPDVLSFKDVKEAFKNYKVNKNTFVDDVYNGFDSHIKKLKDRDSHKTAKSLTSSKNNLRRYNKELGLRFTDITVDWLQTYSRIRRQTVSVSTVAVDFRNLRTVFNQAIEKNPSLSAVYPFGRGKFQIPVGASKNVGLSKEDLLKIKDFNSDNYYLQMARDYFMFSYYANGMNLKDIIKLKKGQKEYIRSKTEHTSKFEKRLDINYNQTQEEIISRHKGSGKYLFNVLNDEDKPEMIFKKTDLKASSVAAQLKNLAKALGLPPEFSFQWARHSYATNMEKAGINLKAVSESLGHTSVRTTESYLKSISNEDRDAINRAKEL